MRPRALVTGAAARVGRAIALELARTGFDVAIHHRSRPDEAEATLAACRALGADGFVVGADLGAVDGCDAVVAAVTDRWSSLSVLVNNASVFYPVPFDAIDAAEWDRVLAVNLRAPFLLARGLLPALRAADPALLGAPADQHGVVVQVVDIGAERPVAGHAHYSVSKAGLAMLVKAMAVELAPAVRTVGVSPGQVAWPDSYDAELRARLARRIPVGRVGTPEDVATVVRFLATEAHYVNGAIVPIDGGLGARY
ncbi:MAG: SDR family oxidoreductase [Myxococcota bacterium]